MPAQRPLGVLAALLVVLTLAACDPAAQSDPSAAPGPATATAATTPPSAGGGAHTALVVLDTLPVKGRAPLTGYSRAQFGPAWEDVDHNGCDTRDDILTRDLTAVTYKPGTHDCAVETGTLLDPYTGQTEHYVRGSSDNVDIDHTVALGDAWQTGAQQWSADKRLHYANDPLVLLAVDASANRQKGDGDAATWLPANKSYRCAYVARQIEVKAVYGLWVTAAEHDAMARVLTTCPAQTVPTAGAAPAPVTAMPPVPDTTSAPAPASVTGSGGVVTYANCAAVRAAGKAPLHAGDPGYSRKLDADGDGIACG